jgi:hypothetical protein
MKRYLSLVTILLMTQPTWAGGTGLVYENEQAVFGGKFLLAPLEGDGFVVPATWALQANQNMLVGVPDQPLFKATLLRLDNILNLAVVKPSEKAALETLQEAHVKNSQGLVAFLPAAATAPSVAQAMQLAADAAASGEPFVVKINGMPVSETTPIEIVLKRNKSDFKIEVVRTAESIWRASLEITSDPSVSFWKKGKEQRLNDVPSKIFEYHYQGIFTRLDPGKSFEIPIEVYFAKEQSYVWTIKVTSTSTITLSWAQNSANAMASTLYYLGTWIRFTAIA